MKKELMSLPLLALLSLSPASFADSIEQADLGPCNTLIDFDSLPLGQQPNPLALPGVTISSSSFLNVNDIAPAGAAYPELVLGQVLTTVLDPGFSGSHTPITLVFTTPVAEVGLGWWDPNVPGNKLMAYDAAGALLEEVESATFPTGGCCADFVGIRRPTNDIASVVVQNSSPGEWYAMDNLSFGGQVSSEVVRLGVPPNPDALRPGVTSGPVIGKVWDPRIDHTTFLPSATFDFMGITANSLNVDLPPIGTLLCDPAQIVSIEAVAAGTPFGVPIPNDCAFVGVVVCTQGVSLDTFGSLHFTNALDITIGSN